jgi:mannose-6-phosphate isomerase-like protein (cupin superfamily)
MHPKNDGTQVPPQYSLAHAIVEVGQASEPHILHKSSELYIILEGKGEIFIGDEKAFVCANDIALVPAGVMQWIRNTGAVPLVFYVIVSPPWRESEEEIL